MSFQKHLSDLRSKLASKKMSLMVGSGFSKNVSDKFPGWEELLIDLVYDLNRREVDNEYEIFSKESGKGANKRKFKQQRCREIMAKKGYLELVSEYLARTNPESIVTYIEDRIPYIEDKDGNLVMEIGAKKITLDKDALNVHRLILELPWNNIYTTNYDQLLDLCVDEFQFQNLANDILALDQEIDGLDEKIRECEQKLKTSESFESDDSESLQMPLLSPESLTTDPEDLSKKKKETADEHRDLGKRIEALVILKNTKEEAQSNCINIVRDASDLQLKRNSNIIKLHGSLRSKQDRENFVFGFDRDHKKQYIISREHYETYPKDHEPFTQLMRISLLQESFCLIGFSGDDPNFLAWVGWVRDILQQERLKTKTKGNYKIYLIDINDGPVDKAKQLFFENYNIARIPLMSPEVLDIIRDGRPVPTGKNGFRETIQMFLGYLGNHKKIKFVVPVTDLSYLDEWQATWRSLNFYDDEIWASTDLLKNALGRLKKIHSRIQIPTMKDSLIQNQEKILRLFKPGNTAYLKKDINNTVLQLMIMALEDSFLPLSYAFDSVYIAKLQEDHATSHSVADHLTFEETLNTRLPLNQASAFQKTVLLAFTFRFKDLTDHLQLWKPAAREINVKAGFLSFISPSAAEKLLEYELSNYEVFSSEQRLYAYELLAFIKMTRYWHTDDKLKKLIDSFKESGFTSIDDNLRTLYEGMDKKPEPPEQLGADRYSVQDPQKEYNSKTRYSLKFLMVLVKSGFQLNIRRAYKLSVSEWYKIISKGFEYYPAAFLYYGLQFNEKNYLKRLGQDYASSSKIPVFVLNSIATNLFDAIAHVHEEYAEAIQIYLSNMLLSIDAEVWEEKFMDLWRTAIKNSNAFEERHLNKITPLAIFACRYMTKETNLLEVLKDCLESVEIKSESVAIDYLYYLNRNVYYESIQRKSTSAFQIDSIIDKIIGSVNLETLTSLKTLGNIYFLLSEDQKTHMVNRLSALNLNDVGDPQIWKLIVYFLREENEIMDQIKSKILISDTLWATGISDNSVSGGIHALGLRELTDGGNGFGKITWTSAEVKLIFEKLKLKLPGLKRFGFRKDPFFSFTDVISEMFWFLNYYKDQLSDLEGFSDSSATVNDLYHFHISYQNLREGLSSNLRSEVAYALKELSGLFYSGDVRTELFQLVINKVLLQADPSAEAALSYLSAWFSHKSGLIAFDGLNASLTAILRKYEKQPLKDAEDSFVKEQLIKIALTLKEKGETDEIVDYYLEIAKNSRYNNIKQLCAKRKIKVRTPES